MIGAVVVIGFVGERDRERSEKERMAAKLREMGIDPNEL